MSIEAHNFRSVRRHAWNGRRPHGRRLRRVGRVLCLLTFLALVGAIAVYLRVTNPTYVRHLAERFFDGLVDADVKIGDARLSLFDGLQLDDVTVSTRGEGGAAVALTAKRLQVSYAPLPLLIGRLESARIVAIEPQVYVVEDVASGGWNLQALRKPPAASQPATTTPVGRPPPQLPEVLIRSGSVHRSERDRGQTRALQTVRLEGQLRPLVKANAYQFNLRTRSGDGAAGPAFQGQFSLSDGAAESSLTNVQLAFLEPLLPSRVRGFWKRLDPTGRVNVPVLDLAGAGGRRGGFRIELQLDDVRMAIRPTDWVSSAERWVLQRPDDVAASLRRMPMDTRLIATAASLAPRVRTGTIPLDGVRGRFIFTDEGVWLDSLAATIDGNPFVIKGRLGGYALDAPLELHLASPADRPIVLGASIPYMDALPSEIREVYYRFAPRGRTKLDVVLKRPTAGAAVSVGGSLEFANADFAFEQFHYPVTNASGRLVVDADPRNGEPRLVIDQVRGNGPADGPNAHGVLAVNGVIAPLVGYASVDVTVSGTDIHGEPALIAAMPAEARNVVEAFDDDGPTGPNPVFGGDFTCRVKREPGAISRWSYDTDVHVRNARGALKDFPYPLEHLDVDLLIRKDYVQVVSARSTHAGGTLEVSGLSEWGRRVSGDRPRQIGESASRTTLALKARGLPIDDALRRAVPPDARAQLDRFGIGGTIDVTGPIVIAGPRAEPSFDLTVEARDGRLAPVDWQTSLDHVAATMQLTPRSLTIDRAVGQRGEARIVASGGVDWSTASTPTVTLNASAAGLTLDAPLRDSLPSPARGVWDSLKPAGATDANLTLSGDAATPVWSLELRPRDVMLSSPAFLPIPIAELKGTIRATADRLELADLTAALAGGRATLNGFGEFGDRSAWSVKLRTTDTHVDRPLLNALPGPLAKMLIDNEVAGVADLTFDKLDWTTAPDGKSTDIAFDSAVTVRDASWRTGVSFEKVNGTLVLRGRLIDDEPAELAGDATFKSFRLAGLDASEGSATIATDATARRTSLKGVRATLGQGDVAGDLTVDRSRADSTRWQANFLLRDADVAALTQASQTKMSGRLNASLAMEGGWNATPGGNAIPTRGRGDMSVTGENMVNVPMILGVTQVVSLKLPFTGGFNEATASYSLDGDRVSFGDIDLQSSEMHIKGAGWLDFDRKLVNLDFYTDSVGKKLPVIGNLLDAARRELFQIKVRGTLEEPTVKAGSLRTITTTVDEILNNEKR